MYKCRICNVFISIVHDVFSFEFLFILFLFAWVYKGNPGLKWVPVDLTGLFFILSVGAGILLFLGEKKKFGKKAVVLVFSGIIFVFYVLISLTWTVGHIYAAQKALYISSLTLWTLIACAFIIASDKRRLARFINLLLLIAAWIAVECTLEYIKNGGDVINALNSNYLALGYTLGMGLLISAAYMFFSGQSRIKKILALIMSAHFMFLLLVLGGRGPLLSATVSLLIPLLYGSRFIQIDKPKMKKYITFIFIFLLSVLSISVYLYSKDSPITTLYRISLLFDSGMGTSAGTRMEYYLVANELWQLKPLFGFGIGSWPILAGLPDMNSYPHNLILEILVELGLAGLALFGCILVLALKGFIKTQNTGSVFFSILILMMFVNALIGAMFSGDINDNRIIFALLGLMAFEVRGMENEKKVCILTTAHQANDVRIFHKECRSLVEAGYEVNLIANHDKDEIIDGIRITSLSTREDRAYRFLIKGWAVLWKAIKLQAYVYHFHDPDLIPAGLILKLLGKKVIYDVHEDVPKDILSKEWIGSPGIRRVVSLLSGMFIKFSNLFFDRIITATPSISKGFPHSKTTVIGNMPYTSLIDGIKPEMVVKTMPAVIYAGALTKIRGVREIIEAAGMLEGLVELWLTGWWEDAALERECRILKGWRNVRYFGTRSLEMTYSIMKQADIGIINFFAVPNSIESLPNKAFEYLACRLPIVMSEFTYWKEIFGKCAIFVNAMDPRDIAEKIMSLIKNPEKMTRLIREGRGLIENEYSWERESKKLIELYGDLFQKKRRDAK